MSKKGYVSIEALIVTAVVTTMGFAIFVSAKDSIATAAARTIGLTLKLTQDMADKLDVSLGYGGETNEDWDINDGTDIKDGITQGQIVAQTIVLSVPPTQTIPLNTSINVTATIQNSPLASGQVS